MILLGHTIFYSGGGISYGIFTDIVTLGYSGVDIFLLLSGFGLVFSIKKNSKALFYKRRIIRLLPAAIGIMAIYCICNVKNVHLNIFNPLFWYNKYWFLGFIIIAYFAFPYLYNIFTNGGKRLWIAISIFSLLMVLSFYCKNMALNCNPYMCALARIPIFCIGVCIAMDRYSLLNNKYFRIVSFVLGIVLLYPFYYYDDLGGNVTFTTYYHFILIVPPLLFYLCKFLDKLDNRILNKILSSIGKYSLEIYLIQVTIMPRLISYAINHVSNVFAILIISILPVLIVSLLFHCCINKASSILKLILYK